MFRKPFQVKSQSQLRSSERRKLRGRLVQLYPALESSSGVFNKVFPAKETTSQEGSSAQAGELIAAKFVSHGGDQGILYSVDGSPILFKNIDDILFPTGICLQFYGSAVSGQRFDSASIVYMLWKLPTMLPTIMTHGPVLLKLFEGAGMVADPADSYSWPWEKKKKLTKIKTKILCFLVSLSRKEDSVILNVVMS